MKICQSAQRQAAERELARKGWTPESAGRWLDFWDQPLMRSAILDRDGMTIGYIGEDGRRRMDLSGKLHQEYQALLKQEPRPSFGLAHAPGHPAA